MDNLLFVCHGRAGLPAGTQQAELHPPQESVTCDVAVKSTVSHPSGYPHCLHDHLLAIERRGGQPEPGGAKDTQMAGDQPLLTVRLEMGRVARPRHFAEHQGAETQVNECIHRVSATMTRRQKARPQQR